MSEGTDADKEQKAYRVAGLLLPLAVCMHPAPRTALPASTTCVPGIPRMISNQFVAVPVSLEELVLLAWAAWWVRRYVALVSGGCTVMDQRLGTQCLR